jgi:hypothetical protein
VAMRVFLYLALVAIGVGLVWYDLRLFGLYAFAALLGVLMWGLDRLWKLQRLQNFSNAGKIMAVGRRVGVSQEDFDAVAKELRSTESAERLDELIKDFRHFQ